MLEPSQGFGTNLEIDNKVISMQELVSYLGSLGSIVKISIQEPSSR